MNHYKLIKQTRSATENIPLEYDRSIDTSGHTLLLCYFGVMNNPTARASRCSLSAKIHVFIFPPERHQKQTYLTSA